ncbi:MAG: hypothetical protein Q7S96_04635 [bacterium]|nr:hypothetical protein [bacterium]
MESSGGEWGSRAMLIAIAILVTLGTSVLSWDNLRSGDLAPRFHWPDETTNAYVAERVARGESLVVDEPRNVKAGNLIHPRTANVRADGAMVPGAYLGLPLWYGLLGRVFGARAMLFFTPLLAGLGLLAFARIVRVLWDFRTALIATLLLAFHGTLWMFTATAFLPNVPFVVLLLLAFAVLVGHPPQLPLWKRGRVVRNPPAHLEGGRGGVGGWLLGGLLIGIALTMRTHEIVWVAALGIVLAWRQRASWRQMGAAALGIVLPFVPVLALNAQLYGSPFTTGYALLHESGALPTEFVQSGGILRAFVAPFGWDFASAFRRFWEYMVVPYWWFMALAGVGVVRSVIGAGEISRFARNDTGEIRNDRGERSVAIRGNGAYVVMGTLVIVAWLILFYGSWTIADPLVRATNVLTISYARYWLPIIVLLAPFAASGFLALLARASRMRLPIAALVFLAIASTSGRKIIADPLEGLVRQRQALAEHRERARAVIAATPDDAVILSHRMDKVFFPERAVVHAQDAPDADFMRRVGLLLESAPVYWYAPGVVEVPFPLTAVAPMPFGETLYRVGD